MVDVGVGGLVENGLWLLESGAVCGFICPHHSRMAWP